MSVMESITSRPIVLVVEDNEVGLRRRAGLLADAGCTPIPVRSREDALRELRASPAIDLILTDIHLVDRDDDSSGVELARAVKEENRDLPVAGYSAYFGDASQLGPDAELFDRTWIKGRMTFKQIQSSIDECRELATAHRRARVRTALTRLEDLRRRHESVKPEIDLQRELEPGRDATAIEQALNEAGYRLRLVDPGMEELAQPIVVWLLAAGGVVEAEVYGHPALYADGRDDRTAIENLVELMRLYAIELHDEDPDQLAGPALEVKRFLDRVMERARDD